MSMAQYYPPIPPPGRYQYDQEQMGYYPQPAYYPPQQYPPPPQHYGEPGQYYPNSSAPYPPQYPPQQSWRPAPPQEGGFHHHAPEQAWDTTYGRSYPDSEFVKPDRGMEPLAGQPRADGERGLGATVIGGAGGAFLGHKLEHGALGTLGGLALGAIAANAFEHHEKKKKEQRREVREYDDGYRAGERRGSRSRGFDDEADDQSVYRGDRYSDDREYDDYGPPPKHSHHHRHEPRNYDDDYDRGDYRSEISYRNDYDSDYRDNYRRDSRDNYSQRSYERY